MNRALIGVLVFVLASNAVTVPTGAQSSPQPPATQNGLQPIGPLCGPEPGPEPNIPCAMTLECVNGKGWVITKTEPEGSVCGLANGNTGTCSVSPGIGSIPPSAVCVPCGTGEYSIGGTVTGLTGSSVVIEDNGGAPLTVSQSSFTFPAKVSNCTRFSVTVIGQPSGEACVVTNPTGMVKIANVTQIAIACTPVHIRYDVAKLGKSQWLSLARGFQTMMENCHKTSSSPTTDPTCLSFQANIHATKAGESGGCSMGDPGEPLWDQCQHASFFFLAWHRLYLYYFEKILRAASGDPTLTLPYWNYESPSEQTLPPAFLSPAADCNGDPAANPGCNPLFVTGRCMNITGGSLPPPPAYCFDAVSNASSPFTPAFPTNSAGVSAANDSQAMSDTVFETALGSSFGGPPPPPSSGPLPCHFDGNYGDLEQQPHNLVHGDVGGEMADPGTAANDPIFWLHHAEIDHLWKVWLAQCGGRANPTDPTWLNTTFSFYDIDTGTTITKSASDVLDTAAQLDYQYDDDSPVACPSGRFAEKQLQFPSTPEEEFAVGTEKSISLTSEVSRAQLSISSESKAKVNQLLSDKEFKHAIVLSLEIDHVQGPGGVHYEIYLNLPMSDKPDSNSIFYVGSLGLFLSRNALTTVKFDLTRLIRAMSGQGTWDGSQLTVTFVPRGLVRADNKQPLPLHEGVRAIVERVSLHAR